MLLASLLVGCQGGLTGSTDEGGRKVLAGITLADAAGNTVSVPEEYEGRPTVLLFWEQGCTYCREELANIEQLYQRHREQDLVIVGIHVGSEVEQAKKIIEQHGVTFPVLYDRRSASRQKYKVVAVPMFFLLDRQGVLQGKILGNVKTDDLEQVIRERLLQQGG